MDNVGDNAAYWYEWQKDKQVKFGTWDEEAFDDRYQGLAVVAKTVIANRDKKGRGMQRVTQNWESDPRGKLWIETYLGKNKEYDIQAEGVMTCIGTIAEELNPLQAMRLINNQILKRAIDYHDPTTSNQGKAKFVPGSKGAHLVAGDIRSAFKELRNKDNPVDKDNIPLPLKSTLDKYGLALDSLGMIEMPGSGSGRQLITFEPLEGEHLFIVNDEIEERAESVDESYDSLLSPAQEELLAEEEQVQEARDQTETDMQDEHTEIQPGEIQQAALMEEEEEPDPEELSPETITYLDQVKEKAKQACSETTKGFFTVIGDGADFEEKEGRAARKHALEELLKMREDGDDIEAVAQKNLAKLLEPGSAKKVTYERNPRSLDEASCECAIDDHLKERLEHGDRPFLETPLSERLKLYTKIIDKFTDGERACGFHVRKYAQYLGLKVGSKETENAIFNRITDLFVHRFDIAAYRIGEGYREFKETPQGRFVRKNTSLGVLKYAPITVEDYMDTHSNTDICGGYFASDLHLLTNHGIAVLSTVDFKWLVSKSHRKNFKSLNKLVDQEMRMYMFHARESGLNSESFALPNMYYSITQQLIRSDLGLYLATVAARGDGKTKFCAYPDFARYVPAAEGGSDSIAFAQADIPDTCGYKGATPPKLSDRVCDFVMLGCSTSNDDEYPPVEAIRNGHTKPEFLLKAKRNKRFHDLLKPGSGKKLSTKFESQVGAWKKVDWEPQKVILAKQGTPIAFNFVGTDVASDQHSMILISANLTAVSEDGQVLENGVSWEDFHRQCVRLEAPSTPRWFERSDIEETSEPFRSVCNLTGLGPLSEALLGRLPWTDRGVINERDRLFSMDEKDLKAYLKDSRDQAVKHALIAFQDVFRNEERDYGGRSFATFLETAKTNPTARPPAPDPQFPRERVQQYFEDGDYANLSIKRKSSAALAPHHTTDDLEGTEDEDEIPEPGSKRNASRLDNSATQFLSSERVAESDLEDDVSIFQVESAVDNQESYQDARSGHSDTEETVSPTKRTFEGVDPMREGSAPKRQRIEGETREAEEDDDAQDESELNAAGYPTTGAKGPSEVLETEETERRRKAADKKRQARTTGRSQPPTMQKPPPKTRDPKTGRFS